MRTIDRQKGAVRQFRGSFQPHGSRALRRATRASAFLRTRLRRRSSSQLEGGAGGAFHAPLSAFSTASFTLTIGTFSPYPSGLSSSFGGKSSEGGPRSIPHAPSINERIDE